MENFKKLILTGGAFYVLWHAFNIGIWNFVSGINLIFHEAGHTIFFWAPEFITVLAGSVFQILVPLVFVVYFFFQAKFFESSFVMLWVAESILNVANYAKDAVKMELPLLGGDGVIHDWNYILSNLHMLSYADFIGNLLVATAVCITLGALYLGLFSLKSAH